MSGNFKLDEVLSSEGPRQEGYVNVARKPDGTWVRIPVIVVKGKNEGPTLLVDACTHGDEYEGAEAVIKVAKNLNPEEFKGTFIGIPALNFDAFSLNMRISPLDHTNLNRVFPGNPKSFITLRIANTYMERFARNADYIISFHGGGVVLQLEPLAAYQAPDDEIGKTTLKMAKAFGTKVLWRMQNLPFDGVTTVEAKKMGVPGIIVEIGAHCSRCNNRWKNIDLCANGVVNVMKAIGMMDGDVPEVKDQIDMEMHYIHADHGGIHTPVKMPLETAEEGGVLAEITDVFGKKISEVTAPFDGIVIGYWSVPVINPGDWSYLYGKILS